ncbi:MAG TPA: hydantoinase B/oxoprolinase family protein [Bryobacteraceae bacterium]|jgi:N-methylhydantoinase B/oxoprolinase/acetone carboxylase alpha subunit|nr:hydantoinase B/oxoprolinase family protein [Bryobacteraceae bacterium]
MTRGKTNPVDLEVFRNLFVSIADEMGAVLRKTAFSSNIKERRDYSCALYGRAGETIAMGDHMPVHLGAMPLSVQSALAEFRLRPGDVAIVNDPFRGGTHLPDITAVSGVFFTRKGPADFYVASRAHHADVGGMSPGSMPLAREIYQEGLRLPPVLLMRGNNKGQSEVQRDVMRIILANVRTPEEREGDLMAQVMANRRGEERLREIAGKYGLARVRRSASELLNYSERITRAMLSRIPQGEYEFEDFLDNDGVTEEPVRIAVTLRILAGEKGSCAEVDFTGTSPQVAGSVNANYAVAVSAAMYCFRCLIDSSAPYNAGLLRPISVITPDRTVVNAGLPAAMAAGNVETSQRITDVILGALSRAIPERIPAASSGTMNNLSFGGWDTLRNRPFAYYETIAGGMGASPRGPGVSAVHTHMTNSWNTPVEAFEHEYPVRVRAYRIRAGSGGAGRYAGGDGIVRELEFLDAAEVTILSDRRTRGPYGLNGARAGATGSNELIRAGEVHALPAKTRFEVRKNDTLRIATPGGGGWGAV